MGKKKKNYQVRNSAGKKYNGSKESKQKAVAKQKTSRPKSQLLDEPIKDDVKVVVGAAEAKEPNRIEELKSQIEKLQADKQAYYEGAENGESEILAAERKDTNSIDRTKIDVEIYRLQKELRELLYKETEANKAQETKENKPEEKENNEGKENKPEEKKNEEVESPEVKALKSQISDLDNKINSEEWVLRNNEGNYLPGDLEQIKAGIEKLKAQRDELNGKLNDLQTGKDQTKSNDTKDGKDQEQSKENDGKDGKGQEPQKVNDGKDGKGQEPPKKDGENKDNDQKQESPEVKALKDKIKELEGKINAESNALMNKGGNYLESDIKEIKARLDELKAEHAELIGKLNDLEKGLKGLGGKDTPEAGTNKDDKGKDSGKGKSADEGKNKEGKEKDSETSTYRIGPFKRFLMSVIRKIKSWAKADGRIAKICDSLEGAVIGGATPLIDGTSEEKEAKKTLNLGKVKDYEKEVADAKKDEYSKDKYEQADDHVEAKAKLDLADMEYIKDVIMKAWDSKETNLMTEVFNKQYKEGFKGKNGINEEELKKFIKENNIPSVTKTDRINAALWRTSQKIVEMAKEKGFVVNQGKGKNANAKPLSEIYPSLESRVKTDRVSEEYNKKENQTKETSKERKEKVDNDKSEKDSKVVKADDDLDK